MNYCSVIGLIMILPLITNGYNNVRRTEFDARRRGEMSVSERVIGDSELLDKVKEALVIINCGNSTGSGFICDMDGKTWLVTNEHVIHSGGKFVARTHSGKKIVIGENEIIEVGENRDLVRILIKNADILSLKIDDMTPRVNDKLYTFGNSDGGQVLTALTGVCLGVGHDIIEVSIPFVQGNSGGAILNANGNVVGVVTYATKRNEPDNWIKTGTRFNSVRRFGVRFIDVNWSSIQWSDFNVRAKALSDLNLYVNILIPLCFKNGKLTLLSELEAKEWNKFQIVPRFARTIKEIASIDEQTLDCYNKIKKLKEEVDLLLRQDSRVTVETQRKAKGKIQKMRHLDRDFENKFIKMEKCRLKALKLGRDYARKSDWRLSRLANEASEIANDLQFFIDRFEYYYKNDLKSGN